MVHPKPLFVMGNKRSGTTVLTNLLNAHPRIFLSHEADTAWILYQARNGRPAQYATHPQDSRMELDSTLKSCKRILSTTLRHSPTQTEMAAAFTAIQMQLLQNYLKPSLREQAWRVFQEVGRRPKPARLWRAIRQRPRPPRKERLAWIGDKKHAQHLDPEVRSFLRSKLPDARYIHIVRHPRGVVVSMVDASTHWRVMPEYFKGTAETILEQWALHEEYALQAKAQEPQAIMTLRLEDLCADPLATMSQVCDFLGLELTDEVVSSIPLLVHYRDPNRKYRSFALPDVPRARRIMELYSYERSSR